MRNCSISSDDDSRRLSLTSDVALGRCVLRSNGAHRSDQLQLSGFARGRSVPKDRERKLIAPRDVIELNGKTFADVTPGSEADVR